VSSLTHRLVAVPEWTKTSPFALTTQRLVATTRQGRRKASPFALTQRLVECRLLLVRISERASSRGAFFSSDVVVSLPSETECQISCVVLPPTRPHKQQKHWNRTGSSSDRRSGGSFSPSFVSGIVDARWVSGAIHHLDYILRREVSR
jgi:hypothetical protein